MKKLPNILKYKKVLSTVFLLAIIASFFFVHTEHSFDITTEDLRMDEPIKFRSTDKLVQQLDIDKNILLTEVSIQFGTYAKENKGFLQVQFCENEKIIEEWTIDTASLTDNTYQSFTLENPFQTNISNTYKLCIFDEFQGDNAIAVWTSAEKGDPCYRNGNFLVGKTLCHRLNFTDVHLKHTIQIIASILIILFGILILMQIDERVMMCAILLTLGCIYMWICTPGIAPDENNHFYRAFEISCGNLLPRHMNSSNVGGNYLPSAVELFTYPQDRLDWYKMEVVTFSNTALYSPVSYLPQATGIKIARCFTDNVSMIFYGGKWGNFIANALLCVWAIWPIPFGRKILFMVMTFPMTMQEMVSMSTDGFTTSLCLAFTAYILYLCYNDDKKLCRRDICITILLSVLLSLCKIVYVVLVFLVVLI